MFANTNCRSAVESLSTVGYIQFVVDFVIALDTCLFSRCQIQRELGWLRNTAVLLRVLFSWQYLELVAMETQVETQR